ncbi:flagellar basal-body rod protein FlgG [Alteribacillus persepolensis]|uniref:Flagellar basal-body rod protein FlgG n=1 Tax=Alteribacillus persepolensis TaxID=568899 RepID=A0A1G8H9Y5_9BACI|nr:flagellar hook-basal body protein [Alteribacillus persepolensis]SDI03456.1 flagellar basal-body rod protein FlgG [Alteribacillus persepolensis]
MYSSMLSSANTMGHVQNRLDGISHNLANSDRTGYKRRETTFSDMLFQQVNNQPVPQNGAGRLTPEGLRVGTGAAAAQTALRLDQGSLKETNRELDFALTDKDVFFQVESAANGEEEIQYTRDGSFYLSENDEAEDGWTLVNNQGDYVVNAAGERMDVPAGARDFTLLEDGTVEAVLENGENVEVGQIELAEVTKPQLLEAAEGNNFQFPDLAELDLGLADVVEFVPGEENVVVQGALEQSNVDIAQAMTDMIHSQRHYSFNARAISQGDQMMGLVNSVRG